MQPPCWTGHPPLLQLVSGAGPDAQPAAGAAAEVAERPGPRGALPAEPEDGAVPPLLLLRHAQP